MAKKEAGKILHKEAEGPKKSERYAEGIGRRKTSIARVRIVGGKGEFGVNNKSIKQYFSLSRLADIATSPLHKLKVGDKFDVTARVFGGGIKAQAEAVRLGLARALALKNPDFRVRLHGLGFLTRDPRMVERKKYGLKKARRAPQWQKR